MEKPTVNVLLVEDDDVSAEKVERAFRKAALENPIYRARDGVEGLAMLRGETDEGQLIPTPYLILLDLKLPRMGGLAFLNELRQDTSLRGSVVFVLTTSDHAPDRKAAYEQQVAGYIIKSKAGRDYDKLVSLLNSYWGIVDFPSTGI